MATAVNVHEAQTHFSKLLAQVSAGEEIIIAKAGKPVARLAPLLPKAAKKRIPGIDKGKIWMAEDFDLMSERELNERYPGDSRLKEESSSTPPPSFREPPPPPYCPTTLYISCPFPLS